MKNKHWKTRNGYIIYQVLSGRSNVFLLTNGQLNILIDTGPGYNWKKLQNNLNNLDINKIDYLILTHTHFDHAANAAKVKEKYKADVLVHKNEASYLENGENVLIKGTNVFTRTLTNLFASKILQWKKYAACSSDVLVDSFFDLKIFGFNAYIINTPGHTIGSMSIIVDDEIALVGDAMFGVFRGSIFPPYAQDVKQMINSWAELLKTNCKVFIPSHGSANERFLVQKEYERRKKSYI